MLGQYCIFVQYARPTAKPPQTVPESIKGRGTIWAIDHRYARQTSEARRRRLGRARPEGARSISRRPQIIRRGGEIDSVPQRSPDTTSTLGSIPTEVASTVASMLRSADAPVILNMSRVSIRDAHHRQVKPRSACARNSQDAATKPLRAHRFRDDAYRSKLADHTLRARLWTNAEHPFRGQQSPA